MRGKTKNRLKSLKLVCLAIGVFCVLLAVGVYRQKLVSYPTRSDSLSAEEYQLQLQQEAQAEQEAEEALQNLAAESSFYQKLYHGLAVNILIVGDSIGAGTDEVSWAGQLSTYITEQYGSAVTLTNVSMGGNASYAGYTRVMSLSDEINYDLAVVCYGQNDSATNFSLYYESIYCAINERFEDCTIISILESSQQDYTPKMLEIQSLAAWYDVSVADTIQTFAQSGYDYDELTGDGIHPNELGKTIYFETIQAIIDENVAEDAAYVESEITLVNEELAGFEEFEYIPLASFESVDELTYRLETTVTTAGLGVYYAYLVGENAFDIYVDGELLVAIDFDWGYDFSQAHIYKAASDVAVEEDIELVFASREQAETFKGIIFSGI